MATTAFKLEDELGELPYDFRTKGNPNAPHGIIAEPSTKQIQDFQRTLRALMGPALEKMAEAQEMSPKERAAAISADAESEEEAEAQHELTLKAIAKLCSDSPSVTDLKSLPYRGQQFFVGWIVGVFLDPNQQTPATS